MIKEVIAYAASCDVCDRYIEMSKEDYARQLIDIEKFQPSIIFPTPGGCKSSVHQHKKSYDGNWYYDKNTLVLHCPTCVQLFKKKGIAPNGRTLIKDGTEKEQKEWEKYWKYRS